MDALGILKAFLTAAVNHRTDDGWIMKKEEGYIKNKWFEVANIEQSLDCWVDALSETNVLKWLSNYNLPAKTSSKKVGIIMAGNIPLVGMHDLLCGLVAGYQLVVKTSSTDEVLPKFWIRRAMELLPELEDRIEFSDSLKGIDLAIATGSNNSARYFEYYFRNIPHILRKNRNSAAVLTGDETETDLIGLGHDVFDYFGLGCRNVTHLLLPENYSFKVLFDAWENDFAGYLNFNKYVNNYHYHRALLLMNLDPHLDTGYILLKERNMLYSPVGMLNYSFYSDSEQAKDWLKEMENEIQCVTSISPEFSTIKPGNAQKTMLWDYADNLDTLQWLIDNLDK